jgi:hypothetical protein
MQTTALRTTLISIVPAFVTMLVVQACGGGDNAIAQQAGDPYEGVWEAQVTQRDCTTNAVLATFRGAQMIHRGGTLSDTNAAAPGSRGPGMGLWSKNGDGSYAVKFRFYRYNPDGTLAGTTVVTSTRTLGADANTYTGTTRSEVRDLAGAVLTAVCVTDIGTRFS